jgi:hypothetical protein
MLNGVSFHDDEIFGIEYNSKEQSLRLLIRKEDKREFVLQFKDVLDWTLSPFEAQNSLFDLKEYDSSISKAEIEYYDIFEAELSYLNSGFKAYCLDPSVGMGGVIFAKGFEIINSINNPRL